MISEKTILLNGKAKDKEGAIREAGALLTDAGYTTPRYVQGMLEREQVTSTYLENGVAIPHGRHDSIQYVNQTGISVVQYPDGILWEPGKKVFLVIGIAADSDDHMDILMNVAEIAEDTETVSQIVKADDPAIILGRLQKKSTNEFD